MRRRMLRTKFIVKFRTFFSTQLNSTTEYDSNIYLCIEVQRFLHLSYQSSGRRIRTSDHGSKSDAVPLSYAEDHNHYYLNEDFVTTEKKSKSLKSEQDPT